MKWPPFLDAYCVFFLFFFFLLVLLLTDFVFDSFSFHLLYVLILIDFGIHADTNRWFALIRIWSPWLAPRQGKTHFDLDKDAVMCSFLSFTGKHLVLLAISGVDDVMTLLTSVDGAVNLQVNLTGTMHF